MFIRLLLLFLVVWFLIWLVRKQFGGDQTRDREAPEQDPEDMVQCEYCGTHVPRSLAVVHRGKNYCSDAHVDLDRPA